MGTLSFMIGAESDQVYKEVKEVLKHMGKNFFNCEKEGMGQTAKLANNLALAIQMRSIAEAMNFGINLGMDGKKMVEILSTCTANCWSLTASNPVPKINDNAPASRDYENGFNCDLIRKDLQLAL